VLLASGAAYLCRLARIFMTPQIGVFVGIQKAEPSAGREVLKEWRGLRPSVGEVDERLLVVNALYKVAWHAKPDVFLDRLLFDVDAVLDQRFGDQADAGRLGCGLFSDRVAWTPNTRQASLIMTQMPRLR
jgi:hypothetical protein